MYSHDMTFLESRQSKGILDFVEVPDVLYNFLKSIEAHVRLDFMKVTLLGSAQNHFA